MANQWLRLWHDMPNDPKWRTIARVSKQPITAVIAVYIHILVNASNATERGRTQNVCHEDLASALDLDTEQVDAIISAMQGRVLDGDMVSGWSKRQVEIESDLIIAKNKVVGDNKRPSAEVWAKLRSAVFERDSYTCKYCGSHGARLECDHVIPVSKGGSHDLLNLVTACFQCNRSKRDLDLKDWLESRNG